MWKRMFIRINELSKINTIHVVIFKYFIIVIVFFFYVYRIYDLKEIFPKNIKLISIIWQYFIIKY